MYGWIWRHIPFKQWQLKTLVSAVLIGAFAALLWYKVFPAVEPILVSARPPISIRDPAGGQVEQPSTAPSTAPSNGPAKPATKTPSAPAVLPS